MLVEVPDQPFVLDALRMVRSELLLARGEIDEAVAVLGPLAAELDGRHGRIFRRIVRVALARARVSSGDPAGAAEALAPVVALWDREEEGPFALSALLPMAGVEVASALGDAEEAARWCAELAAPRLRAARRLRARARVPRRGRRPEPCELLERAACAVEDAGRRWEGAWMRLAGRAGGPARGRRRWRGRSCGGGARPLPRARLRRLVPRVRGDPAHARPARPRPAHPSRPRRSDDPRDRGAAPHRRRMLEPGDRRPAGDLRGHRGAPRLERLPQARRALAARCGPHRVRARAARRRARADGAGARVEGGESYFGPGDIRVERRPGRDHRPSRPTRSCA